jgi:hypothetical protein
VFWVDYLSDGRLVLVTDKSGVYIYDTVSKVLSADLMPAATAGYAAPWIVVSVDHSGCAGPVDEFLVTRSFGTNNEVWQFRNGGSTVLGTFQAFPSLGYATVGEKSGTTEPLHYGWNSEYHHYQGLIKLQGFGNNAPCILRARLPIDAPEDVKDDALMQRGAAIIRVGTTAAYQAAHGIYSRPSFTSQVGEHGSSLLGVTPDVVASMSFAQAAAFVQAGMIGVFPRPEITGYDLLAVLYWFYRNSQRFLREGKILIDGLRAFVGPVTVTPAPTVPVPPSPAPDTQLRVDRVGSNLQASGMDLTWPKALSPSLLLEIVVDEGRPGEWRSGTLGSPWTVPAPALAAGPHAATCYPRSASPDTYSFATVI